MPQDTSDLMIVAAARLLDEGGETAVTIRAVANLVALSHNAPYRHFKDRTALLAAVAQGDFVFLTKAFENARSKSKSPLTALKAAILAFIEFARLHPARYRLLFSAEASQSESVEAQAMLCFGAFHTLIESCQSAQMIRAGDTRQMTALLYACLHGLIDLELGGKARSSKGLGSIEKIANLLLDLLSSE
jgi:AcrR family transcriptional regulator